MSRAIQALDKLKAKLEDVERRKTEPVAIIGMACRFPGGATPEAYFHFLKDGGDAITHVPPERWRLEPLDDAASPEARAVRWGGFLREPVDGFDARFFGISPQEVAHLDPQQRLLLELTWEALERAGQDPTRLVGSSTGVFVGISNHDYLELCMQSGREGVDVYSAIGNGAAFAAGRVSYVFGFQGPCFAVDTVCSSSLVAVHLACQSLRNGESSLAVAGGVNLMLSRDRTELISTTQALSPDGKCKTFDAAANGFVRSEGSGIVVLKLLSDAQRDGDPILALIRGSAVNQDGRSTGLTTPNVFSQQAMLRDALANAKVAAGDIGYVETHGTGTSLGDPIEYEALRAVLGDLRPDGTSCVLGAVKSNVGHLEAAAGVAGLIKVVMALREQVIPGNLHFRALNPRMSLERTPFVIPRESVAWPKGERPRFAGVSSFGMSGTNAHLILAEPPAPESPTPSSLAEVPREESSALFVLSARSPEALRALSRSYADRLAEPDGPRLADIAYTAGVRRAHHDHRLAITGLTNAEMSRALSSFAEGVMDPAAVHGHAPRSLRPSVAFVFSGQGSQWVGMGRQLLREEPTFRRQLELCSETLGKYVSWNLLEELLAPAERSRLAETEVVQPTLFALQIALVKLLRTWGIRPDAVIGHSVGEVAAAHVAGVLTLDEAAHLVSWRGRIMQRATGHGKMVWVALPAAEAARAIAGRETGMSIGAINDPGSVVLSGETAAIDEVVLDLQQRGIRTKPLPVNYAFHSSQMRQLAAELAAALGPMNPQRGNVAIYSTVTGTAIDGDVLQSTYWARNVREPVLFAQAVASAFGDGRRLFLEIGPHPVLAASLAQCLAAEKNEGVAVVTLRRNADERRAMLSAVGTLYTQGVNPDWKAVQPADARCVALPTYPWQRERYWVAVDPDRPRVSPGNSREGRAALGPEGLSLEGRVPVAGSSETPRRWRGKSSAEAREGLIALVRAAVVAVLGLDNATTLDLDRGFAELGLDSLMAVQLRNQLQAQLGVSLSTTLAFDHPNIGRLVTHLLVDVLALEDQALAQTAEVVADDPIAIVGAACRFPGGAEDLSAYWRLLAGSEVVTIDVPTSRWSASQWHDPDPAAPNKTYVSKGGFLREVETFDAGFFRISPREASALDPQQRLLLEVSWEALEDAGHVSQRLRESKTGVFLGATTNEYVERLHGLSDEKGGAYALTGNMLSVAAGRVAFFLGLHGPAMTVDTACSSSLVAMHVGCQSLQRGECDRALVGGVNLMLSPSAFVMLSRMRALAPDGRCKTFSAAADGYARAEGCGVLVLRRLRDALRDGDRIWALIRGTAINHDGASSGLTVPNGPAQQEVIRDALAKAGLAPEAVDYVECHGTGTSLGDPIEVQALGAVFGQDRSPAHPVVLGSAKANIGHMEPAAGIAGVIKVLLAFAHEQIPGQPPIEELNPHVPWDTLAVSVARESVSWPRGTRPRRAGVSAFGLSGTNAHVVLEEAPPTEVTPVAPERPAELLVLSARSAAALDAQAARLREHVVADPSLALGDLAFSLATTRSPMEHRLAMVASSREELCATLESTARGTARPGVVRGVTAAPGGKLAFLFTGQGAQLPGMGRGLHASWPAFREAFDLCVGLFDKEAARSLREVMWAEQASSGAALLGQTAFTQPALFTLEYALASLWHSWGVKPELVAGHSIGELVAACVAGVFSLEDAVRLVAARGRLMQALPPGGAMVSIAATETEVAAAVVPFKESVSIAAINGPTQAVISGAEESVRAIAAAFAARGVRVKPLRVSHAFHSPLMEPMLEAFAGVAASVSYNRPTVALVSNRTGKLVTDEVVAPDYWVRHVREAVRFADGVHTLHAAGAHAFVEVGPKPTLLGLVSACLPDADAEPTLLASLREGRDEAASVLEALGGFWSVGGSVDWSGVFLAGSRRVPLPSYAWQRERHWLDVSRRKAPGDASTDAEGALLGAVMRGAEAVSELLELPEALRGSVDALLPHVAAWRQRHDDEQTFGQRHYDESWPLVAPPSLAAGSLNGTWLLALPSPIECPNAEPVAAAIERALGEVGGYVERVEVGSITDAFGARLTGARGVIALTALDETLALGYAHLPRGLKHTLALAKRISTAERPTPLWIVTRGAVAIRPDEPLPAPLQALHAGLGRVLALEHAEHWGGLIDLPLDVNDAIARLLVVSLGDVEDEIALRVEGRHVRRIVRAGPIRPRDPWQPSGTVVITGGTGALGAHLARWLAERGTPHLVLTSRRGPDAPGARALAHELEARGTRVSLLACDTSIATELDRLFAFLDDAPEGAAVSAVFHVAGLLDDATIANLTPAQLDRVLGPKVTAAWAIHQRLVSRRLAAPLVLFSSIAGFIGGMGQANYAAANAYLDALAQHRRALGLPAVSIQWGPWAEGGMVTAEIEARAQRLGLFALDPAGALRSLELAVTEGRSLAVLDVDWRRFATSFAAGPARPLLLAVEEARVALEERAEVPSRSPNAEPPLRVVLADLPDVERLQRIRSVVATQSARVLGIHDASSLDVDRGFSDLGFDSLMAVELRRVLQAQTGLALPTTLTFDHPSIEAVARYVLERLKGGLARRGPIARPDWPELTALVDRLLHAPLDELKATGVFDQLNALTRSTGRPDSVVPSEDASLDELARYVLSQSPTPVASDGGNHTSEE